MLTASRTGTSVTSLLGLLRVTAAKVISTSVNDKGPLFRVSISQAAISGKGVTHAQNALSTNELDQLIRLGALGVTLGVGLEVTKVTDVADLILGGAVGLAEGVEVRASGGAAVGVVAELVDVEATLSVGVVAGDVP
jgi:hypothetical protein